MATLVLTTVGSLIGGPIGGAIGGILGSQLDRALLSPARKGPRLGDLSVQTSTYGAQIPRIFGTMRVAGTVIWATELREDVHRSGSKAGKTTTYSYSASFAVALSGRPIREVRRIWADGKLLRGADGVFRAETGYRLYLGGEDQAPDPLIASALGIDATPAHRGIAYAVFETLQLADFGNRIPSLSFEVVADDGPVGIGRIADELSRGAVGGADGLLLGGYAASGDSVRGALQAIAAVAPMPLRDDGARLEIGAGDVVAIDDAGLGAGVERQPRRLRDRRAAAALPDEVAIAYHEPERDFQAGLQRARRDGAGLKAVQIELPAAIGAAEARGLAEAALARAWTARDAATVHLPWRAAAARAGGLVTLEGSRWRVRGWTLEKMALSLELAPEEPPLLALPADAGAALPGGEAAMGETVLRVIELPGLGDGDPGAPQLFAAAAGTAPGWRRAELSLTLDGGASWRPAGRTALPAVIGATEDVLGAGPAELFDEAAAVTVALLHDGMALTGADRRQLVAGANLALIGGELLQFGRAEQIGPARWRLSRLLRGRRGTEGAIGGHGPGESFVLIEPATLQPLGVTLGDIGATLAVSAIGPGDAGAVEAELVVAGTAVRPPAPVRLRAARLADGTVRLGWTRRSRLGWTWLDGGDAPLGEDVERYRLIVGSAGGVSRTVKLGAPGFDYSAAEQAIDGASGAITASVVQLGTRGVSPAAQGVWAI